MKKKTVKNTQSQSGEHPHKTTGYLRVSTIDQDLEKNKADILHLANDKGLGKVSWIEEKVSGKVSWKKRKIFQVIEELGDGDNLIVSELSRLGRSMLECMEILSICAQKGVRVYAIKGNWALDGSLQSKIIAMTFAIAAEIERDLISLRTKEALRARRNKGLSMGRPPGVGKSKLDTYATEIKALLGNGSSKRWIAKRFHSSESNLSRWIKLHPEITLEKQ